MQSTSNLQPTYWPLCRKIDTLFVFCTFLFSFNLVWYSSYVADCHWIWCYFILNYKGCLLDHKCFSTSSIELSILQWMSLTHQLWGSYKLFHESWWYYFNLSEYVSLFGSVRFHVWVPKSHIFQVTFKKHGKMMIMFCIFTHFNSK